MILSFARVPDVENIIANDLRNYFTISGIEFVSLFPKDTLKISTDHPFVSLMNQEVPEGGKYNLACLPAVTVIDTQFTKLIETPVAMQVMKIMPSIIDDIKTYGRDQFIMSKQVSNELEELFKTEEFIRADGYETWRKTSLSIEIWAANSIMKSKIFDLVSMYLIGQNRFDLHTNQEVMIEEETINGEKSGIYNFDFGETLYGAMLRFTVGYKVGFYTVKDYIIGNSVTVIETCMI
jgi:hypothetical protein